MAGRVFGAGGSVIAPASGGSSGRINWGSVGATPAMGPSAPGVSPLDQHLVSSFQALDQPTRTKLLTNFQTQAKAGNTEAARKLNLLVPSYKSPVPQTPNYQDNSLTGRIYQAQQLGGKALGVGIDLLSGSMNQTAGEVAQRPAPISKPTVVQGGHTNDVTQQAAPLLAKYAAAFIPTEGSNSEQSRVPNAKSLPYKPMPGALSNDNLEMALNAAAPGLLKGASKVVGAAAKIVAPVNRASKANLLNTLTELAADAKPSSVAATKVPVAKPATALATAPEPGKPFVAPANHPANEVVNTLAQEHADMLKSIHKETGGVTTLKDDTGTGSPTYTRASTNDRFYRTFYQTHGKPPTNADWLAEAHRQLAKGTSPEALAYQDAKASVPLTRHDTQAIIEARKQAQAMNPTMDINTPERQTLRQQLAETNYGTGAANKGHRLDLVLGPPAAGKSSNLVEPLAAKHGSLVIDSDAIKEQLPEFNNGIGASATHRESAHIADNLMVQKALANGDNLVLPRLGKNPETMKALVDAAKAHGYDVHVHHVDLPSEEAAARAASRFKETGRFVDPAMVQEVGNKTNIGYNEVKNHEGVSTYGQHSTDVPFGQKANLTEASPGYESPVGAVLRSGDRQGGSELAGSVQAHGGPGSVHQDVLETLGEDSTKKQGTALRAAYSGMKNEQTVTGNQLSDQLKQLAPDQKPVFWYREAGGSLDKLKQWAADTSKALDPYRDDIKAAMNLSDKGKQVSQLLDAQYKKMGEGGLESGALRSVRSDYGNSRLYKPDAEPYEYKHPNASSIKTETGTTLKTSTSHAKQRVYDTMYDAIKAGKVPATTNAADLMAIHNQELARVNASRTLYDAMEQGQMGGWFKGEKDVPQGWTVVDRKFDNLFAAPDKIAGQLKPLVDPGFLNKIDAYRRLGQYQGLVKTVDLSFSFFHHVTETAQALYQVGTHPLNTAKIVSKLSGNQGEFNAIERDFVKHTGITSKLDQNLDTIFDLKDTGGLGEKISNLPGLKQVKTLVEKNNDMLFGHLQRYLKVMDYGQKIATWAGKHPNATDAEVVAAKRGFARQVNSAYGGQNWEAMGVSKTAQQGMRAVFLAPDWLISNLSLGKMALTEGGTAGHAARVNLATAFLGSLALTEMASKAITGHFTNENPKSHQLEVEVGPHVYISLFRGAIGELVKLGSNIVDNGPIGGVARYVTSKGSPVARTAVGLAGNVNYYGQNIYKSGDSVVKNTGSTLAYALQNLGPVPFSATGTAKYTGSHEVTPGGLAAVLSGIGRYSAPGGPQQRFEAETPTVQKFLTQIGYAAAQPKPQQRGVTLSGDQYAKFKKLTNDKFNASVEAAVKDGYLTGMSGADAKQKVQILESSATKQALDSILGKAAKPTAQQRSQSKALRKYTQH